MCEPDAVLCYALCGVAWGGGRLLVRQEKYRAVYISDVCQRLDWAGEGDVFAGRCAVLRSTELTGGPSVLCF